MTDIKLKLDGEFPWHVEELLAYDLNAWLGSYCAEFPEQCCIDGALEGLVGDILSEEAGLSLDPSSIRVSRECICTSLNNTSRLFSEDVASSLTEKQIYKELFVFVETPGLDFVGTSRRLRKKLAAAFAEKGTAYPSSRPSVKDLQEVSKVFAQVAQEFYYDKDIQSVLKYGDGDPVCDIKWRDLKLFYRWETPENDVSTELHYRGIDYYLVWDIESEEFDLDKMFVEWLYGEDESCGKVEIRFERDSEMLELLASFPNTKQFVWEDVENASGYAIPEENMVGFFTENIKKYFEEYRRKVQAGEYTKKLVDMKPKQRKARF